jgi:hypothetical protein
VRRELRPAPCDPGANRAGGDVQDLADLGVVEGAEVAEDHRGAELDRQGGERSVDVDPRAGDVTRIAPDGSDAVERLGVRPRSS